jgi:LPXTG-site transpeptidase (sortase) family protein
MLPAATVAAPPAAQPPAGARLSGPVLPRSIPTHLAIPDVGIDTALVSVGLNPDKTLEVPADYLEAGWYKYSPTPGEVGPAVIVGHLDSVAAIGVFWELHNVQVGDKIMVTRADGQTHTFVATGIRQVSKDEFPTADIYGNINYAGLRLLTCGGVYDIAKHEYNLNTVVFAKLVS